MLIGLLRRSVVFGWPDVCVRVDLEGLPFALSSV